MKRCFSTFLGETGFIIHLIFHLRNKNIQNHESKKKVKKKGSWFSDLPKGTAAHRREEPGIKPPTLWSLDDTLYHQDGQGRAAPHPAPV